MSAIMFLALLTAPPESESARLDRIASLAESQRLEFLADIERYYQQEKQRFEEVSKRGRKADAEFLKKSRARLSDYEATIAEYKTAKLPPMLTRNVKVGDVGYFASVRGASVRDARTMTVKAELPAYPYDNFPEDVKFEDTEPGRAIVQVSGISTRGTDQNVILKKLEREPFEVMAVEGPKNSPMLKVRAFNKEKLEQAIDRHRAKEGN